MQKDASRRANQQQMVNQPRRAATSLVVFGCSQLSETVEAHWGYWDTTGKLFVR